MLTMVYSDFEYPQDGADGPPDQSIGASSEIAANTLTAAEQEREDERMFEGVKAFFGNRYSEAQVTFSEKAEHEPFYALGRGCVSFLKAVTTFDEHDMSVAIKNLYVAESLASAQLHASKPTLANNFAKLFTFGGKKQFMSNGQLRSTVIKAESVLLIAMLQLFQESIMSYIKAGLNLRRGYKNYETVWNELNKPGFNIPVDYHTKGGAEFGFGTCNLVLSFLPGKIVRIISAIGYKGNRDLGVELLNRALKGRGIRSPLASILFSASYTILTSFAPSVLGADYIPKADQYIQDALEHFPGSDFFTFFAGRSYRLKRELLASTECFRSVNQSLATGFGAELRRLCDYELGMNCAIMLEWDKAAEYFSKLAEENYWSPAFFRYFQAACLEMQGKRQEAISIYSEVPKLCVRKFGGRTILVEQYVTRKVKQYMEADYKNSLLPGLEILLIWNAFGCMTRKGLLQCLEIVDGYCQKSRSTKTSDVTIDSEAMLNLIRASIFNQLDRYSEAHECLVWIFDHEDGIVEEKFVRPFAYWEFGTMAFLRGNYDKAKMAWEEAGRENGYEFEFRLALRLHLAQMKVSDMDGTNKKASTF